MNTNIINNWLKNKNKLLFITGLPGTGKTKLLKDIIKNYDSITIDYIDKYTIKKIEYIFNTNNIQAMVMNNNRKKIVYIEDNTNTNISFFKYISKLNKNIIITMRLPISSKFTNYINTQYHIKLNKSKSVSNNMDFFYYDIFKIINKILSKEITITDINVIYDDIIILYHLIDYIDNIDILIDLYDCFVLYNSNSYNYIYYKLFYLIIPMLLVNKYNINTIKFNKYTNNISKLILSKKKENIYSYDKNKYNNYINYLQLI
tara:strand:- start:1785 stop:2564 length:780 start_codon:yes stop_codon:yes gene_type:complete